MTGDEKRDAVWMDVVMRRCENNPIQGNATKFVVC